VSAKLRLTLAAYHLTAGLTGLYYTGLALTQLPRRGEEVALTLVAGALFAAMALASVGLAKAQPRGLLLASIVQFALLPAIATPWFAYEVHSPLGVLVTLDLLDFQVGFHATLGAHFRIAVGHEVTDSVVIGVNLAALAVLLLLQRGVHDRKPLPTTGGLVTR